MYSKEEIDLITLCAIEELTYFQRKVLLSDLTSPTPDFAKYENNLIKSLPCGVYNKVKAQFFDAAYRGQVLSGLERRGIRTVTYFSQNYPERLKLMPLPPIVLFCKGNLELLNTECFSVVGSRRTQPNILKECKKIAGELTQQFTIVSGMADGADTAAVEGALPSGKVISVLAYGFDHFYPAMNKNLIGKIAKGGLLISEYTPETAPQKHNFPIRNRIIAGLSRGVLVVSAGKKSGALITASYAKEFGRDVFAFPYTIGMASGEGCNWLLKNDSILVENTLDVFGYYGLVFKEQEKAELTKEERELLDAVRELGEAFISELAEKIGVPPFRLIPTISKLEIKGLIARLGGNRYTSI